MNLKALRSQFATRALYPFLLAAYPAMRLYGENARLVHPRYVALPILLSVLGATLVYLLFRLAFRDSIRSAMATALATVLFFAYGTVYLEIALASVRNPSLAFLARHRTLLPLWALLLAAGIFAIARLRKRPSPEFANFAAAVLLAMPLVQALLGSQGQSVSTATPVPLASGTSRPDIYYVILDGYGRADVLRQFFGYDNRPFLDELRKRGFWIGEIARSNYLETGFSLPSSLNFDYLPALTGTLEPEITAKALADDRVLPRLIEHNRLFATVQKQGYRVVNVGSGFSYTNFLRTAQANVGSSLTLAEFDSLLLNSTILLPVLPPATQMISGDTLNATLKGLSEVSEEPSPKLVFAHVLSPHPPYQFDKDGRPAEPSPPGVLMNWENRQGYVGQLQYVNGKVLQALDSILSKSKTPPIIVLQSDHGPSIKDHRVDRTWNDPWTSELLAARSGILTAILAPATVQRKLYTTITPINVFRTILREHFGGNLPTLPDATYYSIPEHPRLFKALDKADSTDQEVLGQAGN